MLRGRCRSCGAQISVRYPLVEGVTAGLFLLSYFEFGLTMRGVASALLCWLLLGLAVTDAETLLLPDALTLPGLVLGVVYSGFRYSDSLWTGFRWGAASESLLWAVCAAVLILLIRGLYWLVRRREGIGLGDAKLLAMIAAWLGPWQAGLVLLLAVVCAAVYGVGIIATGRIQRSPGNRQTARIPLGAFLCAAGIFSIFEGDSILAWYFHFFR